MEYTYMLMYFHPIIGGVETLKRDTTTRFEELKKEDYAHPNLVKVFSNTSDRRSPVFVIESEAEYESWRTKLECDAAWKPRIPLNKNTTTNKIDYHSAHKEWDPLDEEETDIIKKADPKDVLRDMNTAFGPGNVKMNGFPSPVDPNHYKNYIDEYQWLEAMNRLPEYRDPKVWRGALLLQVRKYLDRLGQKDEDLQELEKGLVYYTYLVLYLRGGNTPPSMKEVQERLK